MHKKVVYRGLSVEHFVAVLMYNGDLNTQQVWYSNGQKEGWIPNGPVFECHLNTQQQQPTHLNTRQMGDILFSFVLVQYLNGRSST